MFRPKSSSSKSATKNRKRKKAQAEKQRLASIQRKKQQLTIPGRRLGLSEGDEAGPSIHGERGKEEEFDVGKIAIAENRYDDEGAKKHQLKVQTANDQEASSSGSSKEQVQENSVSTVLNKLNEISARFSRMEIDTSVFRDHFICKISDANPYMEFFSQREDGLQFLSTKKMDLYPRGFEDGWVNVSGRIYLNGEGMARNRFLSLFLDFDVDIEVVPRPDLKIVFYIQNPSTKKQFREAVKYTSGVKQVGIREMVSIEELKACISEQDTVLIGAMLEKI